jgi:terminase small subunit-like protein
LGTRPSDNKSDNNTKGKKMQKKIDRMPKKAFLPGRLTGEAPLPPLGRTGRREEVPLIKLPKQETDNKECKSRTGRPTIKTPELCAEISRRISEGETLTNICRDAHMPAWMTVHDWKKSDESFRQALAHAREQQAEVWADDVVNISDDELPTHEAIGRARLRMQSRQWLAGKFNPQFADKPTQVGVNVGVAVVLSEAERVKLIERRDQALLANQGKSGDGAPIPPEP